MANFELCASPNDFFECVVTPNLVEFRASRLDLRRAYNACISLHSYRDWILRFHKQRQFRYLGLVVGTISNKKAFSTSLTGLEPAFQVIFELSNTAKHMLQEPQKIRPQDTAQQYMGGAFDPGCFDSEVFDVGELRLVVKTQTGTMDVLECAERAYAMWQLLSVENSW